MDSGRFETFIDAIIAIMLTVMVLKIPQPEPMTLGGVWNLRAMYFAYVISFIVIFSIWDHHRKFFDVVEDINNNVIWMYSTLIFMITLIPYFTAWVAHYPNDLIPELVYGFIFMMVNLLYIISTRVALKHDVHNSLIEEIKFNKIIIINLTLFAIGVILSILGYPIDMLIVCLVSVIVWNVTPYIQKNYVIGD